MLESKLDGHPSTPFRMALMGPHGLVASWLHDGEAAWAPWCGADGMVKSLAFGRRQDPARQLAELVPRTFNPEMETVWSIRQEKADPSARAGLPARIADQIIGPCHERATRRVAEWSKTRSEDAVEPCIGPGSTPWDPSTSKPPEALEGVVRRATGGTREQERSWSRELLRQRFRTSPHFFYFGLNWAARQF
ncbi:unnamed protein product [Cutaneotrichosporon oleaginosum]